MRQNARRVFVLLAFVSLGLPTFAQTSEQLQQDALANLRRLKSHLRKVQVAADTANEPNMNTFLNTHMFKDEEVTAAAADKPKSKEQLRVDMASSVKSSSRLLADKFALANFYEGIGEDALKTATDFPGFTTISNHASLISNVITVAAGLAAAGTATTKNQKAANLTTALAAVTAAISGFSMQKTQQKQIDTNNKTLTTAFTAARQAMEAVSVLSYLKEDLQYSSDTLKKALDQAKALKQGIDTNDDIAAQEYARNYIALMKTMDALYDTDLPKTKAALDGQTTHPNVEFRPETVQMFKTLSAKIDDAITAYKDVRYIYDGTAQASQEYLATVPAQ